MTAQQHEETLGIQAIEEDGGSVRFERQFEAPPDEVWRALTEPQQLAAWLADAMLEPRVGGKVELRFDDGTMNGSITEFDPPRALAYTWHEQQGGGSHVRYQLEAIGSGTRLTLVHTRLSPDSLAGFGAGWHYHLEMLAASVRGAPLEWRWERFHELKPRYEEQLTAQQGGPGPER